jgi:hypothetical protein
MKRLVLAFVLANAFPATLQAQPMTPAVSSAGPATAMTPTPDDRAKQWLSLVDDGNYGEAWKQGGPTLRAHQSTDAFSAGIGARRMPLGAMSSRALKDVKLAKTLPGLGSGQFAVVRYDSVFAHQAVAIETVTLASDHGGWSVIAYRVD